MTEESVEVYVSFSHTYDGWEANFWPSLPDFCDNVYRLKVPIPRELLDQDGTIKIDEDDMEAVGDV